MIKIENIEFKFKSFQLGPLDVLIKENTYLGIIGNNGAGKSTLINAICNLIELNNGRIVINEKKVNFNDNSYKSDLGIILSRPYYINFFTTKQYIMFCAKFHGLTKDQGKARFESLSKTLNFNQGNIKIANLSAGNQMKVSLMAAIIHNPKILVFDEPFINLDIDTIEIFIKLLVQLKGKKTLLITSHNLDLVVDLCDTFLIMDKGKIITELQKSAYQNIEDLKVDIKQKLSVDERKIDLQWLQ